MTEFSKFFLEKWIFMARTILKILKMDKFHNTLISFKKFNFVRICGAVAPWPPEGGVIAFLVAGVMKNVAPVKNDSPAYRTIEGMQYFAENVTPLEKVTPFENI